MDKEAFLRLLRSEYNKAYKEIIEGKLVAIPGNKGKPKGTYISSKESWGLTTGKKRKRGGMGDATTFNRLSKLVVLDLITEDDFDNYQGEIGLHDLISSNNSDAKYVMLFLCNRIKEKHPQLNLKNLSKERTNDDFGIEEKIVRKEGARKTIIVNSYERDRSLRDKKIEASNGDCSCSICGFIFEKKYGNRGKGFIHVHHLQALSEVGKTHDVKLESLILVCPNCHAMLHRFSPMLKPDKLKEIIEKKQ